MVSQRIIHRLLMYVLQVALMDPTEGGRFRVVNATLKPAPHGLELGLLRVYTGQDRKGA